MIVCCKRGPSGQEKIQRIKYLHWQKQASNCFAIISLQVSHDVNLVAPYCAIPRDYLSDTRLLRAMGFLVSQHGQLGAIPPPPFPERFPIGEHAKWRCDTPPSKGVSQRYWRDTLKNKANGCDTPLCDTISKRYCAIWGGISHWAAKDVKRIVAGPLRQEVKSRKTPRKDKKRREKRRQTVKNWTRFDKDVT